MTGGLYLSCNQKYAEVIEPADIIVQRVSDFRKKVKTDASKRHNICSLPNNNKHTRCLLLYFSNVSNMVI